MDLPDGPGQSAVGRWLVSLAGGEEGSVGQYWDFAHV